MEVRIAIPEANVTAAVLEPAAEAVTRLNEELIRQGVVPPFDAALHDRRAPLRWGPEAAAPGDEHFDHAAIVRTRAKRNGVSDCDDLAPYEAASLRVTGEDPGARVIIVPTGPRKFHAIVERSSGERSDPSAKAGMPTRASVSGPCGGCAGIGPAATSPLFRANRPAVALVSSRGGYAARADMPWDGTPYRMSSEVWHRDAGKALADAVSGACCLGDASGMASEEDLARFYAFHALLHGAHPDDIEEALSANSFAAPITREALRMLRGETRTERVYG